MKRLFTLLLISFAALSCENVDEKLDDTSGKNDVIVFVEGTELTADVPSRQTVLNYKFASTLDWEVKTDAEWLEIDPMSGTAGEDIIIQVKVKKNESEQSRTAYVDLIVANNDNYRITINQAGEGDDVVVEIPNNQIWYTSTDGEIVEPHSGWYNNYADAHTTFGVNIVSNTYVDGKGVIEFDGDVTVIGQSAFYNCSSLTSVTIPDSVTTIGWGAFYDCTSLTSVTIPDSVTTIRYAAFLECTSLTSVTIPNSVTTIENCVFCGCSSLQEFNGKFASEDGRCLIIDGTLNSFAPAGLTEYAISDSVTTIGDNAFQFCSSLTSITIPDSVTTISEEAFSNCDSLPSVTIGDSVITIGNYAFCGCSSLTSITIPDNVTTIGDAAFCYCSSLQEFNGKFASEDGKCLIIDGTLNSFAPAGLTEYAIPDSVTTIGDYAFEYFSSLTSVTIPDSVTSIGYMAFISCSRLTSITIPDSVTAIGDYAFYGCTSLTSVTIGDSVTTFGNYAFSYCYSLTSVTIDDGVTTIGHYAFSDCRSLTSVTIPDSVTTIGYAAFANCENLNTVYCKAINPPTTIIDNNGDWYGFAMQDESGNICSIGCTIYVPTESVEAYKSAQGWSEYAYYIVGYNF